MHQRIADPKYAKAFLDVYLCVAVLSCGGALSGFPVIRFDYKVLKYLKPKQILKEP